MAGYNADPLQFIRMIRDNLADRYKSGFPVLKEIIQNADDAGKQSNSIEIDFGLSQGIPEAVHPLLQGPALFFINNGNFKEEDDLAIRSFAMNSKAADRTTIGNFGLGMKSVFHFCEAFFYQAKGVDRNGRCIKYRQILNPWESGGEEFRKPHFEWSNFSNEDAWLMRQHLRNIIDWEKQETCFLLWIPLRQKRHSLQADGESIDPIIASYPGDEGDDVDTQLAFLSDTNLPSKLAALLPLLRRVTRYRYWATTQGRQPTFVAELSQTSNRVSQDLSNAASQPRLSGTIQIADNRVSTKHASMMFVGRQGLVDDPRLLGLKNSQFWPTSLTRLSLYKEQSTPVKAEGHCAVIFSCQDGNAGEFITNRAVFLPIADEEHSLALAGTRKVFRMTLHGYFFTDSGRVSIVGFPRQTLADFSESAKDVDGVKKLWNSHLERLGVLPLILPALNDFITESTRPNAPQKLSEESVSALSRGIQSSAIFNKFRNDICRDHVWCHCLTPRGCAWKLESSQKKMRAFPKPPKTDPERPWRIFSSLDDFLGNTITLCEKECIPVGDTVSSMQVTEKDPGHLVGDLRTLFWSPEELLTVLDRVNASEVFANPGLLNYLTDFLSMREVRDARADSRGQRKLKSMFREAYATLGDELSKHRKSVARFASLIASETRYPINAPAVVVQSLQTIPTEILILHKDYDGEQRELSAFSVNELASLLKCLSALIESNTEVGKCLDVAKDLIRSLAEHEKQNLLARVSDLKVFAVRDPQRKQIPISQCELIALQEKHLLFRFNNANAKFEQTLQDALDAQEQVLSVEQSYAGLLFNNDDLKQCTPEAALEALGSSPLNLGSDSAKKIELLKALGGCRLDTPTSKRGFRYLLHGKKEYFDSEDVLWVDSASKAENVWVKIWKHQHQDRADRWSLLEGRLARHITPDQQEALNIRQIDRDGILGQLRQNCSILSDIPLNSLERNLILRVVAQSSEREFWKRLPLHETTRGEFVAIGQNTYLEKGSSALPDALRNSITLIKLSSDDSIRKAQEDWLEDIEPESILKIALNHQNAADHWSLIMDHLSGARHDLKELIRTTPWLKDRHGNTKEPRYLIDLPEFKDEANRLLSETDSQFSSPDNLSHDIRNHGNYPTLRKYFVTGTVGFRNLILLLEELDQYTIGTINDPDELQELASECESVLSAEFPGWRLLNRAMQSFPDAWEYLIHHLSRPLRDDKKLLRILKLLQEEHKKSSNPTTLKCFNAYLRVFSNCGNAKELLPKIELLSQAKKWTPSGKLCCGATGVSPSCLLNATQESILGSIVVRDNRAQKQFSQASTTAFKFSPEDLKKSQKNLEKYFQELQDSVPAVEMIGAFLTILGDSMQTVAKKFKGNHSLDWYRAEIPWKTVTDMLPGRVQDWMYGYSKERALQRFDFIVEISESKTVPVLSITGSRIEVAIEDQFDSLTVGHFHYTEQDDERYEIRMSLRKLQPDVSDLDLASCLRSTAEHILKKVYNQKRIDLSELWEKVSKSDQVDIRSAQKLIRADIAQTMMTLGVTKKEVLRADFLKWDKARQRVAEFFDNPEEEKKFEQEQKACLNVLQDLVVNSSDVQKVLLEAVRQKIRDYQYRPRSIPFELFQNADDAVVELGQGPLPNEALRYCVAQNKDTLLFAHWGRRINAPVYGGAESEGKWDLDKMLRLSGSNKSDNDAVTGKFGLGFKSVFLACSAPIVISGRLATQIVGGIYPTLLHGGQQYREKLLGFCPENRQGTLIALPLDPESKCTPQEICSDFVRYADFVTIFAKRIRSIQIDGALKGRWAQRQPLPDTCPTAELGTVSTNEQLPRQSVLYFRFEGLGGLLFALNPKGFMKLPNDVPGFWAVAPIEDAVGIGIAVNADLDVDTGRTRLATHTSEHNRRLSQSLGRRLFASLRDLHTVPWPDLRQALDLEADLSEYDFWKSLWKVIVPLTKTSTPPVPGSELIANIVGGQYGLGRLCTECDVLPNGLWGSDQKLTRLGNIRRVLQGWIGKETGFGSISALPLFRQWIGDASEVITDTVAKQISHIISPECLENVHKLDLSTMLHKLLAEHDCNITPELADTLGHVFLCDSESEAFQEELSAVRAELERCRFKAANGRFYPSQALLLSESMGPEDEDESLLYGFAAASARLSESYASDQAVGFFKVCRRYWAQDDETIEAWFCNAKTPESQSAALRYLLNNDFFLSEPDGESWYAHLDEYAECFKGWDPKDIKRALLELSPDCFFASSLETTWPSRQTLDPTKTLNEAYEYWSKVKDTTLPEYQSRVYPHGEPLDLEEDEVGNYDRRSWLKLLFLGHCCTIGRATDEQHRGFIEKCLEEHWWDIFSEYPADSNFGNWMDVLERFISEQDQTQVYDFWMMNHFPALFKLSRYLDEYREIFLSLGKYTGSIDLNSVLGSRASAVYQGGGISAPPLNRTLGYGANFVVRELLRYKILQTPHEKNLYPLCYVPTQRVRHLFQSMGCSDISDERFSLRDSETMYRFVCEHLGEERATFDGAFDIALTAYMDTQGFWKSE